MQTIVIGHKNPDMDAVVSAIAYAEFKKAMGEENVVAGRAGNINERVAFALEKFGAEEPAFFSDLSPRVEDVMEKNVILARDDTPLENVLRQIGENRFRGLPVVDAQGKCVGLISSFKISRYLFPPANARTRAREVTASLADISSTFEGISLTGKLDSTVRPFTLVVAAMKEATFMERMRRLENLSQVVVFVGDRSKLIVRALELGVGAVVLTSGLHVPEDLIQEAVRAGVSLIESPLDTATSVLLSRSAMPARLLLDEKYRSFAPETPLEEARRAVSMSNDYAFPVVEEDGSLVGILSKSDFIRPVPRQLILVDHNEISQAVSGAEDLPVIEIIDHHRISTITTDTPILFVNRPVGSTSTIVATCYQQAGLTIPPSIAGLLMCGLLSDTLNLTSPTTTEVDRQIMRDLESITRVNPTELANEIFSVGSPLLTMTAEAAITADLKPYEEKGRKFSIAQIEELSFSNFQDKAADLLEALETYRKTAELFFAALLVTDVNTQESILLVRGAKSFTNLIDYPEAGDHMWRLSGVVSRKKQLLPYLSGLVARAI